MYICKICNKEYKSRSGLNKHMKSKHEGTGNVLKSEFKAVGKVEVANSPVIELEHVEYYEGHPRREVKLKGMLSRTTSKVERDKIESILQGLSAGYDLATSNL